MSVYFGYQSSFFFFNAPPTTKIYTLSLHDALPIYQQPVPFKIAEPVPVFVVYMTAETDEQEDRKSTRLNSSHVRISYAVFCLKKKKDKTDSVLVYEAGYRRYQAS